MMGHKERLKHDMDSEIALIEKHIAEDMKKLKSELSTLELTNTQKNIMN